jgi:DNA modification methylase
VETRHRLVTGDAREMREVADGSVHLVVTSPPYPMIEMWDAVFGGLCAEAGARLEAGDGAGAFEAMHGELDRAWGECHRALAPGGIACVNVGDATRTLGGAFRLWPNHARVVDGMTRAGFVTLPDVLWRKPTNAPNKFLGSGMLPAGAYVTYEHEYVLIFRKGGPRAFVSAEEKARRRRSAFFWEERNVWFSDVWTDLVGVGQGRAGGARERSGAFPFELAWRLVQMFSLQGDVVLDPFVGTGTAMAAAAASGRHSIGVEREAALGGVVGETMAGAVAAGAARAAERLEAHRAFVREREAAGRPLGHWNRPHGLAVVTGQEAELEVVRPESVERDGPGAWTARAEVGAGLTDGPRTRIIEATVGREGAGEIA